MFKKYVFDKVFLILLVRHDGTTQPVGMTNEKRLSRYAENISH